MLKLFLMVSGRPKSFIRAYSLLGLFLLLFCGTVFLRVAMDKAPPTGPIVPTVETRSEPGVIVMIDPGHGGRDPGSLGKSGLKEKEVVLDVSMRLMKELKDEGITVHSTREDDVDYGNSDIPGVNTKKRRDLATRLRMIGECKPDLLVSIHANSFPDPIWYGAQTFYYRGKDRERDKALAKAIQDRLVSELGPNHRTSKHADIYVLRKSEVPAVTVEVGFLSNPKEEALLGSGGYRQKLAESVCGGILDYLKSAKADGKEKNEAPNPVPAMTPIETLPDQVVLYFAAPSNNGEDLSPELRSLGTEAKKLPVSTLASNAMKELFKGPGPGSVLHSAVPEGIGLRNVYVSDGVAHVDLSRTTGINEGAGSEELAVMSIVNTLTGLPGINRVKLTVDGRDDTTLSGHIMLDESFGKTETGR